MNSFYVDSEELEVLTPQSVKEWSFSSIDLYGDVNNKKTGKQFESLKDLWSNKR